MSAMNSKNEIISISGLFVGMLTPEELEIFERAIKDGIAYRSYEGASGFMGLAKVKLLRKQV